MKVPLAHDPFPPVALSRDQERQLQWLSDTLVEETLAELDDFVVRQNRVFDKAKWKHVMSREDVTIYKRTGTGELGGYTPDISLYEPNSEPHTKHWHVPTCVGVGTLAGSIDEVLYGLLAVTKTETEIRTSYTKDEAVDGRVLANIVFPSETKPLCSLLVRWSLMRQIAHSFGTKQRDTVCMESTGTRVLPSGDRIGYAAIQSVDVPGCEELTSLGLIRARHSTCYIFRDTGLGSLEVFVRSFVEPGGSIGTSLAVFSTAMSLIAAWRLVIAAHNKKLAYVARTNLLCRRSVTTTSHGDAKPLQQTAKSCRLCLRMSSSFRSLVACDLCLAMVCSRCVDKRKLTHVDASDSLVRTPTRICKGCLTTVASMSASDIAVNEHAGRDTVREIRRTVSDNRMLRVPPLRPRVPSSSTPTSKSTTGSSRGSARHQHHHVRDTLSSFTTTTGSQSLPRNSDVSSASYARSDYSDVVSVTTDLENVLANVGAASSNESDWQTWIQLSELHLSDDDDMPILSTTGHI